MKLLVDVDTTLEPLYVKHDVPIYCHDHPTETDVLNAALKALKDMLKNIDWPEIDGHQVLSLAIKNITDDGSGNLSIDVSVLENPVSIGTIQLRDNSGTFEFSTDGGSIWQEVGSGGGVTDHTLLTNIGTNTHAQIDSHIADSTQHFSESSIDHTNIQNIGTNTHAQIDSHMADSGIHGGGALSVLRGDGLSNLAQAVFASPYRFNQDMLTLFGVVSLDGVGRAESFFKIVDQQYGNMVLDFGKNSSNQLYVTQGDAVSGASQTMTSQVVFTADNTQIPLEVGVMIDRAAHQIIFFCGGAVEPAQSTTQDHIHDLTQNQQVTLGDAFDGDLYFFGISNAMLFDANTTHTPLQKGFQCARDWLLLYDMTEGSGTTLTDRYGTLKGSPYNLTINGSWQQL